VMVGLVFISAMMVVFQVFEYRHDYRELSSYMRERDDLNAVTQLRLFSPPAAETVVIYLPMTSEQNK
uniref:cell division protein FtsL n=1 Tax=Acinetobacter baumannii TaxID=470 RepID=UPI000A67B6D6